MNASIRLLLADDHQIVRMGLAALIGLEKDLSLAGEARNGLEAVRLARELKPDVILMDLMMPKMDGAAATAEILADNPQARVLVLTTYGESELVRKALDAGATGALIKDAPNEELVAAIRNAAAGKRTLSPEIRQHLADADNVIELSPRQAEVLNYIARGLNNKEIGRLMNIGHDGVNAHLRTIFSRLGASSRAEAVAIAMRSHLLAM